MLIHTSPWTTAELEESVLRLCDEMPEAPMAIYSRVVEYCRRATPHGSSQSLLTAMRQELRWQMELERIDHLPAPEFASVPVSPQR